MNSAITRREQINRGDMPIEEDDPVNMMKQLRTSRLSKGLESVSKGTAKAFKGASRSVAKATKKVVPGTQKETTDKRSPLSKIQQHNVEYDEEAAVKTEKDPLLGKNKAAPRSGAALWTRLREAKDDIVFTQPLEDQDESSEVRKSRHLKEMESEFRSAMEFSLTHCLMAIVLYLGVAVLAYSFVFEQWPIVDSCYFAVVSFTTTGYGDVVPTSDASRMFTAFFALSGVACLGIALGVLGSNLVEAETKAIDQASKLSQRQVMSVFDSSHDTSNRDLSLPNKKQKPKWYRSTFVKQVLPLFTLLLLFCWRLGKHAGWDLVSTFYYCVVTATTIGFGDMTPETQSERLFAIPVILLAVASMGIWLGKVADFIIERRQAAFRQRIQARELTIADLEVMDADQDGQVTLAEYLTFMLVSMGKIDQQLMDELSAQFNRLDVDGTGCLEKQDLIIVAKRKLKSSKRKLELAQYKQDLLRASSSKHFKEEKSTAFVSSVSSQLHAS